MKEIKDIEKVFRDKLQNFEAPVNPSLWKGIQTGMGSVGVGGAVAGTKIGSVLLKSVAVIATIGAIATGVYFLTKDVQQNHPKTSLNQPKKETTKAVVATPVEEQKNTTIVKNKTLPSTSNTQQSTAQNRYNSKQNSQNEKVEDTAVKKENLLQKTDKTNANSVDITPELKATTSNKSENTSKKEPILQHKELNQIAENNSVTNQTNLKEQNQTKILPTKTTKPSFMESLPNVFTPNGDGENDVLLFKTPPLERFVMVVYTQNGEMIYKTTDATKGWNGYNKFGKLAAPGVYIYQISAIGKDGKDYGAKLQQVRLIR